MQTVHYTRSNNLCVSCELCAAVCPVKCIDFHESRGMMLPLIREHKCLHCGKCFKVCPGKLDTASGLGNVKGIYIVRTKNADILANAVSGGAVTELISGLLREYDCAFVIRGHTYDSMPETEFVSTHEELRASQKSRYVIVSHRKCAEYMLSHPEKRIILVGTSCFVHGIMNLTAMHGLNRKNYFIIGLFCDRTMTLNVIKYFRNHHAWMKELYFRTKDVGGWPGGVRLIEMNGNIIDLPASERMKVKDYFQPERCLYCLDKLNVFADISAGDNYTGRNSDSGGSSSIIIRTEEGLRVWRKLAEKFEVHESSCEEIHESQHIAQREDNCHFARIKQKGTVSISIRSKYRKRLHAISLGEQYGHNPQALERHLCRQKFIGKVKRLLRNIWHKCSQTGYNIAIQRVKLVQQ